MLEQAGHLHQRDDQMTKKSPGAHSMPEFSAILHGRWIPWWKKASIAAMEIVSRLQTVNGVLEKLQSHVRHFCSWISNHKTKQVRILASINLFGQRHLCVS